LIEALRILLNEKSKIDERRTFDLIKKEYDQRKKMYEFDKNSVLNNQILYETKKGQYIKLIDSLENELGELIDEWMFNQIQIWVLNESVIKKMVSSIGNYFKVVFNKTDEQKKRKAIENNLLTVKEKYSLLDKKIQSLKNEYEAYQIRIEEETNELNKKVYQDERTLANLCEELKSLSDGKIRAHS